jgi:hypothetical protein
MQNADSQPGAAATVPVPIGSLTLPAWLQRFYIRIGEHGEPERWNDWVVRAGIPLVFCK